MQAAQTQIDAFHAMTSSEVTAKQQMVLDAFHGDASVTLTREEISARINMKLGSVCGRVNELVKAEVLAVRGSKKCIATGNKQQLIGLPMVAQ